jgi:hypothetical protein
MLYPLNYVNRTSRRGIQDVNRPSFAPPAVGRTSHRQPLEIEWCPRLETNSGLVNRLATSSNVRGRQWTLVDNPLRPASKSGR